MSFESHGEFRFGAVPEENFDTPEAKKIDAAADESVHRYLTENPALRDASADDLLNSAVVKGIAEKTGLSVDDVRLSLLKRSRAETAPRTSGNARSATGQISERGILKDVAVSPSEVTPGLFDTQPIDLDVLEQSRKPDIETPNETPDAEAARQLIENMVKIDFQGNIEAAIKNVADIADRAAQRLKREVAVSEVLEVMKDLRKST